MNRRNFLKSLGAAAAAITLPISSLVERFNPTVTGSGPTLTFNTPADGIYHTTVYSAMYFDSAYEAPEILRRYNHPAIHRAGTIVGEITDEVSWDYERQSWLAYSSARVIKHA